MRAPPCRTDDVDRHPDRDLADCVPLWLGQIAWMLCSLILPAFSVERGTLDRLGRGLPLHDLDLGDGPVVPSCVRRVLRLNAVGRCA